MKISQKVIDNIVAHARREAPLEACGYLAGRDGIVSDCYELKNTDESGEHFSFDPQEQFAAVRHARGRGLRMIAVYHSHPATPARPSTEDIRLAFDSQMSYVIVSLCQGKEDVKSFKIKNGKVKIEEIDITCDD